MLISAKPPVSPSVIDPEEPPVMPIVALVAPPPSGKCRHFRHAYLCCFTCIGNRHRSRRASSRATRFTCCACYSPGTRHLDVHHLVILGSFQPFHLLHQLTHIIQKCLLLKGYLQFSLIKFRQLKIQTSHQPSRMR